MTPKIRLNWNIILILRLVLALIFALTAFIFTEVMPDIRPLPKNFLRVMITIWFGLLGYGVFPDLAQRISSTVVSLINLFTEKVSNQVMDQMMRLSRQNPFSGPMSNHAPIGTVTVNLPLILDTSAIIDGRILDIAKTGFLFGTVLIPEFVLTELQQVADSSDYLKRTRARRGFEIIEELKKIKGIRVEIWDKDINSKTVDDKLMKLAKSLHGKIITTDYNLNRVASLLGVQILNINDLGNTLKTLAIPGETIKLKLVHLGKDPKQGVGYLNDGTMIVVEDGAQEVGQEIKVEVTRMLQSSAGRMIFSKKAR